MKKLMQKTMLALLSAGCFFPASAAVEVFEIQGLISPASPPALISELEQKMAVKVVDLNLKNTETGWPLLSLEYDSGAISRSDIEKAISEIEDPAGHNYKVHTGPPMVNEPYIQEENDAIAMLGPATPSFEPLTNPIASSSDSINRGKALYDINCTTCHGLSGNGHGPAAHGITTFPRQLYAWSGTDASTDGYLFWFITNGRNEMPPWGLVLSENERWDLINYIKSMPKPE